MYLTYELECDNILRQNRGIIMIKTVKPELIEQDTFMGDNIYAHDAFGQISIFRSSGGKSALYGSDIKHNTVVNIRIHTSKLHRGLSRNWYGQDKLIADIEMSEAQWATFVSSFNIGSGVPCTLKFVNGDNEYRPHIENLNVSELFNQEAKIKLDKSVETLKILKKKLTDGMSGLSQTKRNEAINHVDAAIRELASNFPFVMDQFEEYIKDSIESAKTEVHSYVNSTLRDMGLEKLTNDVVSIEENKE